MKRNFVILIVLSILLLSTSCTLVPNSRTSSATAVVVSNTSIAPNTIVTSQANIVETEVSVLPLLELSIGDGGLLSGKPCESPCFFGVQLGETKFDQVIPTLKANGLSPCFKNIRSDSLKSVVCGTDEPRVTVDIQDDIVNGLGYKPSISLSIGDILAKYGKPNRVAALRSRDNSNNWLMIATLYWDSLAMQVDLPKTEDTGEHIYRIENTTDVESIYFWDNKTYMQYSREESEMWHDYGVYKP